MLCKSYGLPGVKRSKVYISSLLSLVDVRRSVARLLPSLQVDAHLTVNPYRMADRFAERTEQVCDGCASSSVDKEGVVVEVRSVIVKDGRRRKHRTGIPSSGPLCHISAGCIHLPTSPSAHRPT